MPALPGRIGDRRRRASRTCTATFGSSRRSTTKISSPLASFARLRPSGATKRCLGADRAAPSTRSSVGGRRRGPTSRGGSGRVRRLSVSSYAATACCTPAGVTLALAREVPVEAGPGRRGRCCTGSAGRPCRRSRRCARGRRCTAISSLFLARSSSAGVGPVAASRAISRRDPSRSRRATTPGRALAITTKQPAISVPRLEGVDGRRRAGAS